MGRVIARPYVGKKRGEFHRTSNRRDYALKPTGRTVLNAVSYTHLDVYKRQGLNYAMSLYAIMEAHSQGYDENMYLDAATRTKVEETGGANFIFITKDQKLVTPCLLYTSKMTGQ